MDDQRRTKSYVTHGVSADAGDATCVVEWCRIDTASNFKAAGFNPSPKNDLLDPNTFPLIEQGVEADSHGADILESLLSPHSGVDLHTYSDAKQVARKLLRLEILRQEVDEALVLLKVLRKKQAS